MDARHCGWVLVPLLAGCQPNTTAAGTGMNNNSVGEESGDESATGTTGDSAESTVTQAGTAEGGDTTDGVDDTTGPSTTGDSTASGTPLLEISDGPTFDYGNVPLGEVGVHVFSVTNVGDGPAEGIAGQPLGGAFDYEDGAYPGTTGTCGDSLDPAAECTLAVTFAPTIPGLHAQPLELLYDGAATVGLSLAGGGAGTSENLLLNPGGEVGGSPPANWTNVGVGTWRTGSWDMVAAFQETTYISANDGPNGADFLLIQQVSAMPWIDTIDQGLLTISFRGWVATLGNDNDEYRIQVHYRDAGGTVLETWSTNWGTGWMWTQRGDARLAPVGTRTIEVELGCRKDGGSYCDAFYDALDLRAVFP